MKALVSVTDAGWRRVVLEALRRCGHRAKIVADRQSLSRLSRSPDWQLLVLSVSPDVADGVKTIRDVRRKTADCPRGILAVTGTQDPEWIQALLAAGADDCVTDPLGPRDLEHRLTSLGQRIQASGKSGSSPEPEADGAEDGPANRALEIPLGRYRSTIEGRFLDVDQTLVEILGYGSREELLSVDLERDVYVHAEVRQSIVATPGDNFRMVEMEWKRKDGRPILVRVSACGIRDDQGKVTEFEGMVEDVTRRKQVEAQLRAALVHSPIATLVVADDGRIVSYNRAAEELTGFGSDQLRTVDQWLSRLCPDPDYRQEVMRAVEATRRRQHVSKGEYRIIRRDGQERSVQFHVSSFSGGYMVQLVDNTQQRAAQEESRQKQRMLRQLLDLHERDRQLMAYELHDGFCQQLAAAMMRLQAYQCMREIDAEEAERNLDGALGWLGQSITEARRLIGGLRPPILDESGIVAAVDYLAAEVAEDRGLKVLFNQNLGSKRLATPLETCLFRVIQESVRNARRYSKSDRVQVDLWQEPAEIVLTVQDWGVGFDLKSVDSGHFGLQGIRERARWLGGHAEIETAPGEGTRITMRLPLIESNTG